MIPLAVWLTSLGYGLVYVAFCNLKTPANGISFADALNPRLKGGPCKDGSCTKCSGTTKTNVSTGSMAQTASQVSQLRQPGGSAPLPVGQSLA